AGEKRGCLKQLNSGGEGGIRTLGTASGTTDFESAAIDHSATSPQRILAAGPVSVRLGARVGDDLAPAGRFGFHIVTELRWRHARRDHALLAEGIGHARILDGLGDSV